MFLSFVCVEFLLIVSQMSSTDYLVPSLMPLLQGLMGTIAQHQHNPASLRTLADAQLNALSSLLQITPNSLCGCGYGSANAIDGGGHSADDRDNTCSSTG